MAAFEFNLESTLLALQRELLAGTYRPGGYRHFVVALCRVIEPLFDRAFLPQSFATRLGKGSHRAMRQL